MRCSKRCAKPVLPRFSFFEPTWYQTLTATIGALWSSWTTTVRPFERVNFSKAISGIGGRVPPSAAATAGTTAANANATSITRLLLRMSSSFLARSAALAGRSALFVFRGLR